MKTYLTFLALLIWISTFSQENGFSAAYNRKLSLFHALPDGKREIIFLGNSMTAGCEWAELLQNKRVKNRGISGDTTKGVLYRLSEVTSSSPERIFLLIGINDLATGVSGETIVANICKIAEQVRKDSPRTRLFVQSLLPVNDQMRQTPIKKDEDIVWVNSQLQEQAEQYHFTFIDLYSHFVVPGTFQLNPLHTNDGGHFKGSAYLFWAKLLKPYL
jgi:lysophospholipase L1-like esterase